jgi:biotin synthase-like enzyme
MELKLITNSTPQKVPLKFLNPISHTNDNSEK